MGADQTYQHSDVIGQRLRNGDSFTAKKVVIPYFMGIGFVSGILLDLVLFADRTNILVCGNPNPNGLFYGN